MTSEPLIFILGLAPRTGTNYLFHLLSLHPGVVPATRLPEDFLLHHADLLLEYVRRTTQRWNPRWQGSTPQAPTALVKALGTALRDFLVAYATAYGSEMSRNDDKRLVFKTPSVANLAHFFELFPGASLLVMVRDGRDTVESGVRSFGWKYEAATRRWCRGALTVLEFDRVHRGGTNHYRLVRYEDVVRDPEGTMRELLRFLDLDVSVYDFGAARGLPVYGSSDRESGAKVDWKPLTKTEAFNPLGRWERWSAYRRRRFAWVAGGLMAELGYPVEVARMSRAWRVLNSLVDRGLALYEAGDRLRTGRSTRLPQELGFNDDHVGHKRNLISPGTLRLGLALGYLVPLCS
jgi:Sulfotransferase family